MLAGRRCRSPTSSRLPAGVALVLGWQHIWRFRVWRAQALYRPMSAPALPPACRRCGRRRERSITSCGGCVSDLSALRVEERGGAWGCGAPRGCRHGAGGGARCRDAHLSEWQLRTRRAVLGAPPALAYTADRRVVQVDGESPAGPLFALLDRLPMSGAATELARLPGRRRGALSIACAGLSQAMPRRRSSSAPTRIIQDRRQLLSGSVTSAAAAISDQGAVAMRRVARRRAAGREQPAGGEHQALRPARAWR